ncbi:MAG: ankyrin repeat domain-containing protein [Sulfobacillus sp.]
MDCAAANGHLPIVTFLHQNRTEGCTKNAIDRAAENGHLPVVTFLHQNRTEGCTKDAMDLPRRRMGILPWSPSSRLT